MALPQAGVNLVAVQVFPIEDLGLAATVTSAATEDGTPFHTGYPATILVTSKLTSGSGTLKLKIGAASTDITYGSPTDSLACSGTSRQVVSVDTTTSALWFGMQQSSAGSCVWDELAMFVMYKLADGNLPRGVKNSHNAAGCSSNPDQDGTGVVTLDIA